MIKITDKQRQFAINYAHNGGNASKAARDSGYSVIAAAEIGRQLLGKMHVQEIIMEEQSKPRCDIDAAELDALINALKSNRPLTSVKAKAAGMLLNQYLALG